MTIQEAIVGWRLLSPAKFSKLSKEARGKMIKILADLKKATSEYEAYAKDAQQLAENDFDKMERLKELQGVEKPDDAQSQEKAALAKECYEPLETALKTKGEEDASLGFAKLTADEFDELFTLNDWSGEVALWVQEAIVEQ